MQLRKIIIGLGCAAPLIGSYYIVPRSTLSFDFYDNYFIFAIIHVYHLFSKQKHYNILPGWLVKGFSAFLLCTLLALYNNPDALGFLFVKQFFGAVFSASSYFLVFKLANFNILYIFTRYLHFAFFASLLALVEEALHLNGIHIKTAFPGALGLFRVGGLSGEPYNLSLALFPALFFYLYNLFYGFKQEHETKKRAILYSIVIFTAFFLTFSSTGYVGMFLAFFIIVLHKGYLNFTSAKVLIAPIFFTGIFFIFSYLTTTNENFNQKVEEGLWFLQSDQKNDLDLNGLNASSFALLSNYQITMEGLKANPLFGIGIGSYETLFNNKYTDLFGTELERKYGRSNFNDANSMFLRLLAEGGIAGLAIFIIFSIRFLIKTTKKNSISSYYLLAINHGAFILFLIRLLRCGNYLSDGMFFFIFLFYYSYKQYYSQSTITDQHHHIQNTSLMHVRTA